MLFPLMDLELVFQIPFDPFNKGYIPCIWSFHSEHITMLLNMDTDLCIKTEVVILFSIDHLYDLSTLG